MRPTSNWKNEYIELAKDKLNTSEELWCSLKSKPLDLGNKFLPLEKPSNRQTWKENGSIPINKLTKKAIKNKNKKHRPWMLANTRKDADVARLQYTQARNKDKRLLRKAKRTLERQSHDSLKPIQKHSGPILEVN